MTMVLVAVEWAMTRTGDGKGGIARIADAAEPLFMVTKKIAQPRFATIDRGETLQVDETQRDAITGLRLAAECSMRSPIHVHTLEKGEALGEVAGTYGVRVRDLVKLNPQLVESAEVPVGFRIRVCPSLPPRRTMTRWHTLRPGDTWGFLAQSFGVKRSRLQRANPKLAGTDLRTLKPGTEIAIPVEGERVPGFPHLEGKEHAGILEKGVPLPPSPHYELKRPWLNFGTQATVDSVQALAERYWEQSSGHRLLIGDLSRPGGGPLVGHRSHQQGRDVDIGIPVRFGERRDRFVVATPDNLDHERSWAVVKLLLEDPNLAFIFVDSVIQKELYDYALKKGEDPALLREVFQHPRQASDRYGVIRHFRGHADHFHIRFRR